MAKIGIDCRFSLGHSGIGRYTRELVPALLSKATDSHFTLFVRSRDEEWLKDIAGMCTIVEAAIPHYSIAEQLRMPSFFRKSGIELLFSPHFNVPLRCPVPFVVTIHDLILHRYPNQASFLRRRAYHLLMKRSVRRAERIIAVSAFTAQEISRFYGEGIADKMTVIHEGVSSQFSPRSEAEQQEVRRRYGLKREFFLYVGNAKEHKNVQLLLDAYAEAHPQADLVLVSEGKETKNLSFSDGATLLSSVPDKHLPALYSAALAMVTPSLYEGFCLPLLEAVACGCPVIATNSSAIAELAPPGVLLIEPDVHAFTHALKNPPPPSKIPHSFSWQSAAEKTLSLLQEACR